MLGDLRDQSLGDDLAFAFPLLAMVATWTASTHHLNATSAL
jgi:hypothetical protein